MSDGELILAWTNLGALVEGTLKLVLCVYYDDFEKDDVKNFMSANIYDPKKQAPRSPDGLALDKLIKYVEKAVNLDRSGGTCNTNLVKLVQKRRNAIHSFQNREIGGGEEFWQATKDYFYLVRDVNDLLPYPDDWPALGLR